MYKISARYAGNGAEEKMEDARRMKPRTTHKRERKSLYRIFHKILIKSYSEAIRRQPIEAKLAPGSIYCPMVLPYGLQSRTQIIGMSTRQICSRERFAAITITIMIHTAVYRL